MRTINHYVICLIFLAGILLSNSSSVYSQWSDPTMELVEAQSAIRAHHYRELRNAIDNKRVLCGLAPFDWENPSLIEGRTAIRAVHLEQLRQAIVEVYNLSPARPLPFANFTDQVLSAPGTPVRLVHLTELRQAYESATCCGDTVCNSSEDSSNCPEDCLCSYGVWQNTGLGCGAGSCDDFEIQITATDQNGTPGCNAKFDCQVDLAQCCIEQEWMDKGCGEEGCDIGSMYQENYTLPDGCPVKKQCVDSHLDCCQFEGSLEPKGCGLGNCAASEVFVGRNPSKEDCPSDPEGSCYNYPDFNCCQYNGVWIDEGCGKPGATVSCANDMVLQTQKPSINDASCPVQEQCVPSDDCCAYGEFIRQACGVGDCSEFQVLEISTPANPSEKCQPQEHCSDDNYYCCNYPGPEDKGCGETGAKKACKSNQILQVDTPQNGVSVDCPLIENCVTDVKACCNYSGPEDKGCGETGVTKTCKTNQILQVDTPKNGVSVDCPIVENCSKNDAVCCHYGDNQPKASSCGQGGCRANELMIVQTAIDCPEKQTGCVIDESCYQCVVGSSTVCATPQGCPGTQECPDGLLAECIQSNSICTPGKEYVCYIDNGAESVHVCNDCGDGWGPCSCDFGNERPCEDLLGCPGVRTCANGAWESCIATQPKCVPGTTNGDGCSLPSGLQGSSVCNACGSGYGDCSCMPQSTKGCTIEENGCSGLRTCLIDGSDFGPCVQTNIWCN